MQDFYKSNLKIVEKYKNKFHISKQPGISRKSSVNTINWSSVVKITGNRNNEKPLNCKDMLPMLITQ